MNMENQMKRSVGIEVKPAIGEWKIGDGDNFISFALTNKPNLFRRMMANLFFGLRWIDYTQPKEIKDVEPSKGVKAKVTKVIPPQRRNR